MSDAFGIVVNAIGGCFDLFNSLSEKLDFVPIVISFFVIFLVWRFLLSPIFSSGQSDSVKKEKK